MMEVFHHTDDIQEFYCSIHVLAKNLIEHRVKKILEESEHSQEANKVDIRFTPRESQRCWTGIPSTKSKNDSCAESCNQLWQI